MCTMVILRRPADEWPLLVATNRDEMGTRRWKPPARHWPDRAHVTAGLDEEGGGSWLGINDYGLVAGVLNRTGSLGPAPGKRSRGELVLEALDHASATDAARALADVSPAAYRPFNLVIADINNAWLVSLKEGEGSAVVTEIPAGLSMITDRDLNDISSPRIKRYLPLFARSTPPDPGAGNWGDWPAVMAARESDDGDIAGAMMIAGAESGGFGTVSSSIIAMNHTGEEAKWIFSSSPGAVPQSFVNISD